MRFRPRGGFVVGVLGDEFALDCQLEDGFADGGMAWGRRRGCPFGRCRSGWRRPARRGWWGVDVVQGHAIEGFFGLGLGGLLSNSSQRAINSSTLATMQLFGEGGWETLSSLGHLVKTACAERVIPELLIGKCSI